MTHLVNSTTTDPAPVLAEITGGLGPHSVIDAVSNASSLRYMALSP